MAWVQGYEPYGLLIEQVALSHTLWVIRDLPVNPPYRFLAIFGPCNTLMIHEVTLVFVSALFYT
jgi:hypothetical protein